MTDGAEHPNIASHLSNIAVLLETTNRLAESEPLIRRALAIDEQSYGAEHPAVARDLHNLAALLNATNRLAEAEPMMRQACRILLMFTQRTGHQHPDLNAVIDNYSRLLLAKGFSVEKIRPLIRNLLAEYGLEVS